MQNKFPTAQGIVEASTTLEHIIEKTPLQLNSNLSELYQANVYLKREDLQKVRSYKIRGAYNFISKLSKTQRKKGVVCASAGNHAQGFALSCFLLNINGVVFMPQTTPKQKVDSVKRLGKEFIDIELHGDSYDDAKLAALRFATKEEKIFVPPFDDVLTIEGQGTVGLEILEQLGKKKLDYIFVPIGGGGLASGIITYFKEKSPNTIIIGVEPLGAPAMQTSIAQNKLITLNQIDSFVDGAAVKQVGHLTFDICKNNIAQIVLVPEGRICTQILRLYNRDAIITEPAGTLAIAALDFVDFELKGKNIVCIVSGGNNDIERMPEIKERSLIYEGLKHYFMIKFPQRSGALKQFVNKVLGPDDDITLFEYTKKNTKESGPALVGIELKNKDDYDGLLDRMKKYHIDYTCINNNPVLFNFLI
jgi:threonine dehydratase